MHPESPGTPVSEHSPRSDAPDARRPFLLERIIEASSRNAFLIIILVVFGIAGGIRALTKTPLDKLGVTSNIMSLGGIAIAIGAMVDAAIIMVENAHKALERGASERRPRNTLPRSDALTLPRYHRRRQEPRASAVLLVSLAPIRTPPDSLGRVTPM